MFLKNRRPVTSASDDSSDNSHKAVKKKKVTKRYIEVRKITYIIINYSITIFQSINNDIHNSNSRKMCIFFRIYHSDEETDKDMDTGKTVKKSGSKGKKTSKTK